MKQASLTFGPELKNVSSARHFVLEVLDRWEVAADTSTAALLVSELVSNSVVHGGTEVRLSVRADGPVVTVEVADDCSRLPRRRPVDHDSLSGRGMAILEDLADEWGVRSVRNDGKVVWCRLRLADD